MPELPTGTVTFLFTDIEGSTKLLHELGEAYADALAEHRRILRQAFERHGGVEVDTQGDAFFVAFAGVKDALAAAREGQQALADGPIKVRIGLHTGEPTVTEEGYVGLDVHRAARIAGVAHGGQVVVSARTREYAGDALRDLGLHRLKDIDEPERLFQVGEQDFPPLRSLNATNLPAQASPLVGRSRELAELKKLVASARLVTLTGSGGSGKTRLAIDVAAELVTEFVDGVFWVPLAGVSEPALVVPTIARTLGADEELARDLDERSLLLLLDNFEQVLPAAGALADLLTRCPNLHLLVTTRTLLRLSHEREYRLEPLPEDDAVALFRERAVRAEPIEAVAEICRRLDGLPLAIELAAARTALLAPADLVRRLDRALPILNVGRRDAPARQQTLRATIEWSHGLLSPEEQRLFAQLAAFAGSFGVEAADAICDCGLDSLQALVEHSLVRSWPSGRLGMLETIREFAHERLEETSAAAAVRHRHVQYFADFAERAELHLRGREQTAWLDRLEADHENLRAAFSWGIGGADVEGAQRLAAAVWPYWHLRSQLGEGLSAVTTALAADGLTPARRASLLHGAAVLAYYSDDKDAALRFVDRAIAIERDLGDAVALARSLTYAAIAAGHLGDRARARAALDEALVVARTADEPWTLGVALWAAGAAIVLGRAESADASDARALLEESIQLLRDEGDPWALGAPVFYLAVLDEEAGDLARAAAGFAEAASLFREVGDKWRLLRALNGMSQIASLEGDVERAEALASEAARVDSDLGRLVK